MFSSEYLCVLPNRAGGLPRSIGSDTEIRLKVIPRRLVFTASSRLEAVYLQAYGIACSATAAAGMDCWTRPLPAQDGMLRFDARATAGVRDPDAASCRAEWSRTQKHRGPAALR